MRYFVALVMLSGALLLGRGGLSSPLVTQAATGNTITVTSNVDDFDLDVLDANATCDFREAILAANRNAPTGDCPGGATTGDAVDTIQFNIPGDGPHVIAFDVVFPEVSDPVIIDARTSEANTQCDVTQGRLLSIILDGSAVGVGNGLLFDEESAGSTVQGLVLYGFSGVPLVGASSPGLTVQCTHVGVDETGLEDRGNAFGMTIGDNGLVGGPNYATDMNIISGNDFFGLAVFGENAKVINNHIGLDVTGAVVIQNEGPGIQVDAAGVKIGESATTRNYIAGNDGPGIQINATGASVKSNYVGLDITGTVGIGNEGTGIQINAPGAATIGGSSGEGNFVASNGGPGIQANANAQISYNIIGQGVDGSALPNQGAGIEIMGANTIASLHANGIYAEAFPGIDNGGDGIINNDDEDVDTGPNALLNAPVLTFAGYDGWIANLSELPNDTYRLDLFTSPYCLNQGGTRFVESWESVDDTIFVVPIPSPIEAFRIVATSETTGATSEFSNCIYTSPDVNCDLDTNALDALSILFGIAGFPEGDGTSPALPCSADVNQDGNVDMRDALWMRRFLTQPV